MDLDPVPQASPACTSSSPVLNKPQEPVTSESFYALESCYLHDAGIIVRRFGSIPGQRPICSDNSSKDILIRDKFTVEFCITYWN